MMKHSSASKRDWLYRYFQEIDKTPLLKPDEEKDLLCEIHLGSRTAFETLIKSNLKFVVKIAMQYRSKGLPIEDLINEGNCGLIKAIDHFDETLGFKFISYAVWWIRQSILRALSEHARVVRIPVNRIGDIQKVSRTFFALSQQYEREPRLNEVAAVMDRSTHYVSDALQISRASLSFDAPHPQNVNMRLGDVIESDQIDSPDSGLLKESLQIKICELLNSLTIRQAKVVKLYFGLDHDRAKTLDEIGEQLHISRERVRQIKEKAIVRLKHVSRSRFLREYLG